MDGYSNGIMVDVLFFWFFFGFFFGIVNLFIAHFKGKSGCAYFLLGFFFNVIGVIIALIIQPDHEKLKERGINKGKMKKCPHCAEIVAIEATKCRYCQSALNPAE